MTKAWDALWEDVHKSRGWGSYPEEALIRFVASNYYDRSPREEVHFLDLGCGGGASTWYLCREGFGVSAIDGSASAVEKVRARLAREGYSARCAIGDVTALPYEPQSMDCVVEIGCLTCMNAAQAKLAVAEVRRVLKPKGRFLSFTPARGCWGDGIGREVEKDCFTNANEGPFAGLGLVRFLAERDIREIYSGFGEVTVDRLDRSVGGRSHVISHWNIVCRL